MSQQQNRDRGEAHGIPLDTGVDGVRYFAGHYGATQQAALMDDIAAIVEAAPYFTPRMPRSGRPFSVKMTNCGPLGWVADQKGYRYQREHPETGAPWPAMPESFLQLWTAAGGIGVPEAGLINRYESGAKMGLHQDRDEIEFDAPVVSLSLGDTAVFRIGGTTRRAPTRSLRLHSGDVLTFGGPARLVFHGVDRIIAGSSRLVPGGGRINLTLRRVNPVEAT